VELSFYATYRPALPQQTRWLGLVSRGSNTWEVELYQRRRPPLGKPQAPAGPTPERNRNLPP